VNEIKMQKQVRRAKMWNTAVFCQIAVIVIAALFGFGVYRFQHTFTVNKWLESPSDRTNIVANLLEKHKLIGMTEEEIISLLGKEENNANAKTSFKISNTYFEPENTIVYYLGVDYIDDNWLIISLENAVVISYCIDIT